MKTQQDSLADTRRNAAKHIEESKEMAREVAQLCEKASRLSLRIPETLSPNLNVKGGNRSRAR